MIYLFINTSKPNAVAALIKDEKILARQEWTADRTLGKVLLEVIENLLERYQIQGSDIDRIAVHAGPGHFGGLRSGITVASSLALAWQADLISLSGDSEEDMIASISTAIPVTAIKPIYETI